jgi:RNA polymerase sigma factor (sigma-70 family)
VERLETIDFGRRATMDADLIVDRLELDHGQALFGFVRRQGLTDAESEDAVQDALVRLWLALRSGSMIGNPRAWAFRTVYRLAMDHHRRRARLTALIGRLGGTAGGPARDASDRIAVWEEVDRLPDRQRQVLYLRYRADLSFEEIGEVLEITSSAARSHATQALARLRRRLGPDGAA